MRTAIFNLEKGVGRGANELSTAFNEDRGNILHPPPNLYFFVFKKGDSKAPPTPKIQYWIPAVSKPNF
jgi:hypothetical protein